MAEQYTKKDLEEALPPDLWRDVIDYLDELDGRHGGEIRAGWDNGRRRVPHC